MSETISDLTNELSKCHGTILKSINECCSADKDFKKAYDYMEACNDQVSNAEESKTAAWKHVCSAHDKYKNTNITLDVFVGQQQSLAERRNIVWNRLEEAYNGYTKVNFIEECAPYTTRDSAWQNVRHKYATYCQSLKNYDDYRKEWGEAATRKDEALYAIEEAYADLKQHQAALCAITIRLERAEAQDRDI